MSTWRNTDTETFIMSRGIKNALVLLCAASLLFVSGCRKKKFRQITEADAHGFAIESDLTDWTVNEDEKFPRKIESEMDDMDCGNPTQGNTLMLDWIIAYPNPTDGEFRLFVNASNNYVKVVIASWFGRILYSECEFLTSATEYRFNPQDLGMKEGKHYRIYYRVHADDESNTISGHGDFLYMNNQEYYEQKDDF